jgi:hypothetical protein
MHEMKDKIILKILVLEAKIGVTTEKIWRKVFQGPICNFWKVARAICGNTFGFQGLCLEFLWTLV